jgi:hypothetical protein
VNSLDKGHNKVVDSYKQAHMQNDENPDAEIHEIDEDENLDSTILEYCTIFDKCRACSFKEL